MNVIVISPGYPADIPEFVRGLAQSGATVIGIGDQAEANLPELTRKTLSRYLQVATLWDASAVIKSLTGSMRGVSVDRIECLWEPGVMLAAQLREHFGIDGLSVSQAHRFRDKEAMKQALDQAGIRTPRHIATSTAAGCYEAAESIGYPVILKPIAGAGSADTYRVNSRAELRAAMPMLRHVPAVSVEEFVDGEEYTFDALCVDGRIAYFNVAWYRPRPLVARSNEWISPQVVALREVHHPDLAQGIAMGEQVLKALEFGSGFSHMEWYKKADGEVVFGEIGARPPGAHQVDQMKFACDFDVFRAWGQAVASADPVIAFERNHNVATIYKRARGVGQISHIEGEQALQQRFGEHVVWNTLLKPGQQRRDWRQTLVSDGFIMLRHPDLEQTLSMADAVASELHLFAQ